MVFVAVVVFSVWLSVVFLGSLLQVKRIVAVGQSCWSISFLHGAAQSLVLLLDGVYSPKMKGANRLKFI